jgi:phage baseplate assembly protein W
MAVTKALSIEDGNLQTPSIVTTRNRKYSDLDLTFAARPTCDVFKKTAAAAVKQSVKTILQTNFGERPFQPNFGADLRSRLFENFTDEENVFLIEDAITDALALYEPRAELVSVNLTDNSARNYLGVRVEFRIVNTEELVVLDTAISRIR